MVVLHACLVSQGISHQSQKRFYIKARLEWYATTKNSCWQKVFFYNFKSINLCKSAYLQTDDFTQPRKQWSLLQSDICKLTTRPAEIIKYQRNVLIHRLWHEIQDVASDILNRYEQQRLLSHANILRLTKSLWHATLLANRRYCSFAEQNDVCYVHYAVLQKRSAWIFCWAIW